MNATFNPLIRGFSRGIIWTPARVDCELSYLAALKFFEYQWHECHEGSLRIIGRIGMRQVETGKLQTMVVEVAYPKQYPWDVPRVFDYEKRFKPSAKGHQFVDYGLCLSFPLRDEFALGSDLLSCEILKASLVWLDKRLIFERIDRWPGEQEEHGWAGPLRQIIIEKAGKSESRSLRIWTAWIAADSVLPNYDGGCPCCSGRAFRQCHRELALLVHLYVHCRREEKELNDKQTTLAA